MTYFRNAVDSPGVGLPNNKKKKTTLVKNHKYFLPIKFHQNLSSESGEVKMYIGKKRTTHNSKEIPML